CTGYQEDRTINQIGFFQKLKDSVPPPSTIEVVFNCCQFTRKDTDVAISFSLQTFTACTGYQENRMINQIGFVQKLKGFYMNTYLRGKEKCRVVSLDLLLDLWRNTRLIFYLKLSPIWKR
ncbi:hypothetical protein pdam_00025126, partial [Pocillopora damicornis]